MIKRDAFLYLEPREPVDVFAQCSTCRLYMPTRSRCAALDRTVGAGASCGLYLHGEPSDAQEATASCTAEEAGLVNRQVRCENCRFFDGECDLFKELNEAFPQVFDLATDVDPKGCCNAQTPGPVGVGKVIDGVIARRARDFNTIMGQVCE